MKYLLYLACWSIALASTCHGQGGSYPTRPVRALVGFSAGGPTDVIARLVAQNLSQRWGQQIYVEDLPGAAGNIAASMAKKAAPDGYTVHFVSSGFVVNPSLYANIRYDPVQDFEAVSLVAESPNVLVVNPRVPAKNVQELVALIKGDPKKYSIGTPGRGTTPALSAELFKQFFQLDVEMVPFQGATPAVTAVLGNHVPVVFTALPAALPFVKAGELKALAITSATRSQTLPDVPTMEEAGATDQIAATMSGLVMPKGTPKNLVDLWYKDIADIVGTPQVKKQLNDIGYEPVANTPDQFAEQIRVEMAKWRKVIKEAGIKPE